MDADIIISSHNGEHTSMQVNGFIGINDESLKVQHTAQKVNGDANVYSDDSEEGDDIDDESVCDSFYSGMVYTHLNEYFINCLYPYHLGSEKEYIQQTIFFCTGPICYWITENKRHIFCGKQK